MEASKHFVLVHGMCLGAWCWYKLSPLLKKAGHRVTALDMAASGINTKSIEEVHTFKQYSEPLLDFMASLPKEEKVIVVGHSLGGMNLALAMEEFPQKISAAVFLCALVPDTINPPSFVVDKLVELIPEGGWLDTEFTTYGCPKKKHMIKFVARQPKEGYWLDTEFKHLGDPETSLTTMFFGPKFLFNLYHLSPIEDFELAMMLKRPSSFFMHSLRKAEKFSEEGLGSVRRVFVVCELDKGIPKEFQLWMAENSGVKEVKELKGADHMPMFSMPQNLCDCLLEIALKHS